MRNFTIFFAAMLFAFSASAQDLLVKRNGERLNVKVLKISNKKIEYVRHGTELPVYTIPVSDVDYIEYPMGDRDTFGRKSKSKPAVEKEPAAQTTPAKWHGAVPAPDGRVAIEVDLSGNKAQTAQPQTQQEQKTPKRWHGAVTHPEGKGIKYDIAPPSENETTYNIGDIYNKNGVKGIVVLLSDGGRHGVIMSLDEVCLVWSNLSRKQQKAVGASDRYDGEKNMKAVEKYIAENALSWSNFPAFEWCRAKGEGWYLPSINELWSAGTMYLGGSRTISNRRSRKHFNDTLKGAGGVPLSGVMIYHSSTEDKDARYALYSHMNSEPPYVQPGYKADDLFVRAFHKF